MPDSNDKFASRAIAGANTSAQDFSSEHGRTSRGDDLLSMADSRRHTSSADWQFSFTIQLTIRPYKFNLQLALQYWLTKMRETIRASEQRLYRGPKRVSGVEGLRWRTLAESDARMGRVTRGKDSSWWHFSVDRFPVMDLSPGPTPATLNRNCWCRWFYIYSRRVMCTCVYLRAMHFYSRDYFANFLRLKVLNL